MRIACALGVSLAIVLAGGLVHAQQVPPSSKATVPRVVPAGVPAPAGVAGRTAALDGRFARMDTNHDGAISSAEFQGPKPLFARLDANKDGKIGKVEVRQVLGKSVGLLKAMDVNHDGKVTRAEFKGPETAFAKLDVDKDGAIGKGDASALRSRGRKAGTISRTKPTAKPATPVKPVGVKKAGVISQTKPTARTARPRKAGARVGSAGRLGTMFTRFDANKDGKVDKKEYLAAGKARFKAMDADRDGAITQAELTRTVQARIHAPRTRTVAPVKAKPTRPARRVKPVTTPSPVKARG